MRFDEAQGQLKRVAQLKDFGMGKHTSFGEDGAGVERMMRVFLNNGRERLIENGERDFNFEVPPFDFAGLVDGPAKRPVIFVDEKLRLAPLPNPTQRWSVSPARLNPPPRLISHVQ